MLPVADVPKLELVDAQVAAMPQAGGSYAFHDPCVLGTRLNVVVDGASQDAAYQAACAARVEIDRLDRVFNWRDRKSEISRLNNARVMQVSADLFDVVVAAEHWRAVSEGAYSGRLGRLLERWRCAGERLPDRMETQMLARAIGGASIGLDAQTRTILRPDVVRFDFDGIAKGHIVDRALAAAMAVAGVSRAMVDIGGDVRCAGDGDWRIELPAPLLPFDNAAPCGAFSMSDGAVATSGCGPRDRRAGANMVSATIDPRTGWPVSHWRSATAVGPTALAADALATAMLVLSPAEAAACIARMEGMSARVTRPGGVTWLGQQRGEASPQWIEYVPQQVQGGGAPTLWKDGWYANVIFTAPPKEMRREIAFRSPYVAIWVSGVDNKPVRTLFMVGRYKEWHEGNHVWWRLNRARLDTLFARSLSTRGSGTYKVYWDGVDDDGRPVPPGRYRINVETSREGGGHSHRYIEMDFSQPRVFEQALPMQPDKGGLEVSFQKF